MRATRPGFSRWAALAAACCIATAAAPAAASSWQVARGPSAVTFTVSHLIFTQVEGRFTRFGGSVELPGDEFEAARIEADIQTASIHTGHRDRDRHLVSDEFLDAETFPSIRFVSRSVRSTGEDRYEIVGDLTIRGVSREVVLAAKSMGRRDTEAGPRLDFEATGAIDRSDFGLRWNRIWDGRAVLGDEVEIQLEICLVPTPDPEP